MSATFRRRLAWAPAVDRETLSAEGYDVVEFSWLCRAVVGRAGSVDPRRVSLENPAQAWLDRVASRRRLAVVDVHIRDLDDLRALHGYVLAPVLQGGGEVLIESPDRLTGLVPEKFVEPEFEYPYTLERALDTAMRLFRGEPAVTREPDVRSRAVALDAEQLRAVDAPDGVVQVIAPAGSGKTTVLVERVRELQSRGVSPERILCATFNRDAAVELQQRLAAAGLGSARARTFHSIGRWLLEAERLARPRGVGGQLSLNQWRRLCAMAAREEGTWLDPGEARAAIGEIKLGLLATPGEYRRRATEFPDGPVLAAIYTQYERELAERGVHDFDDLVFVAVRALREDPELRGRWQRRFDHVLVDEYQDIEPAQELLVRILAAPEDRFFCVGDEDQTLYGWRRASVRRIIELDLAYPWLSRVSLAHNYRCPREVVHASRRLIEHNAVRFPKRIEPAPRTPAAENAARLSAYAEPVEAASRVAGALGGLRRGDVVVLARTTNLLRSVALACADRAVAISAPEQIFEPHGARGALEAYLRLCGDPRQASAEDVATVHRVPGRGLPLEQEAAVARRLRAGDTFTRSLAGLAAGDPRGRLAEAGAVLDALARITDARAFIRHLRGPGGLDAHFQQHERTFGGTEQIEIEVLEQSEREAAHTSVREYSSMLQARRDRLQAVRDDEHGIELTTVHRAKGREWPEVHLFGCEEGQLPHKRSLEVDAVRVAEGEGLEAERRLAYVGFTRAAERLVLHHSASHPSRFLTEAGVLARRARPPRPDGGASGRTRSKAADTTTRPRDTRELAAAYGPAGPVIAEAYRIGLNYALRTAPSRAAALDAAAVALERDLIGEATTSSRLTVGRLLDAIESLRDDERVAAMAQAAIPDPTAPLARLSQTARDGLARAIRRLPRTA